MTRSPKFLFCSRSCALFALSIRIATESNVRFVTLKLTKNNTKNRVKETAKLALFIHIYTINDNETVKVCKWNVCLLYSLRISHFLTYTSCRATRLSSSSPSSAQFNTQANTLLMFRHCDSTTVENQSEISLYSFVLRVSRWEQFTRHSVFRFSFKSFSPVFILLFLSCLRIYHK